MLNWTLLWAVLKGTNKWPVWLLKLEEETCWKSEWDRGKGFGEKNETHSDTGPFHWVVLELEKKGGVFKDAS